MPEPKDFFKRRQFCFPGIRQCRETFVVVTMGGGVCASGTEWVVTQGCYQTSTTARPASRQRVSGPHVSIVHMLGSRAPDSWVAPTLLAHLPWVSRALGTGDNGWFQTEAGWACEGHRCEPPGAGWPGFHPGGGRRRSRNTNMAQEVTVGSKCLLP